MLFFRRTVLMEDIPDVFGAVGFVEHGFADGADECFIPVFVFKGQKDGSGFLDRLSSAGDGGEIIDSFGTQRGQESDIPLAEKIIIGDLVKLISEIADADENVGDKIQVLISKQAV